LLEIENDNPTLREIDQAFKKKALEVHPDKPKGECDFFQKVKDARDTLIEAIGSDGNANHTNHIRS
jgi:curved DNA-binding protein CbpA